MTPNIPNTPVIQTASRSPQEVHLYDYLSVILRRKTTFAVAFFAIFIGVVLYTFVMKPIYEASATLFVKDSAQKAGTLGELSFGSYNPVDSEIEIFKSRTNAEKALTRLHLNWRIDKKSDGLTFKLLDFSSTAKKPIYRIKLTGVDAFTVEDDDGNLVGQGKSGLLMQGKEGTLLIDKMNGNMGDSFRLTLLPFNDIVATLRDQITAAEVGKNTNIMRIAYSNPDPALARDVVNTLIQAYLEQSVLFRTEEASRTVGFVEEQLQALRRELDVAEKNLQVYKSSSGVMMLDAEGQALIGKLAETEKARAEVALQKRQVEFALDALRDAMRRGSVYSPAVMNDDPIVAGLASRLSDLEVQKRALRADYTEAHPAVKTLQGQIEETQQKIRSTYETSLTKVIRQQEATEQQMAVYEGKMRNLPEAERDLARLTRLSKVNADIYTMLLQKHEEARIARASTISNINIVDPAIAPTKPIKPQKALNLLLGFLTGCMMGIGLAFFIEYLDDTIKDADQAKRALGLPLLAMIPHIPRYEPKANMPEELTLITQLEPKSMVSEAFRALRTSLHFSAINREKKIMLITSTFPGEGKSVISANLANILSQTGARVLIVDCDLRRSSLHEKFGRSKNPGLSEILTGDVTFAEAKHNTNIPGLDLISSGTNPPNPSELLGSEPMRRFLLTQRENYDHIVIDAPPILAVSDAPVLTAISDVVVLIMEAGRVPIKVAQHVRETLSSLQAPLAGFVMNDKTGKGESYGYYGGRYYRYGKGKRYGNGYGYGYGYGYYSDEDSDRKPRKKLPQWKRFVSKSWKNLVGKKLKRTPDDNQRG